MNSRFTCFMCGTGIDLDSKLVLRYVKGWARGTGKTMAIIEQEDYKFVHEFCLKPSDRQEDQSSLF